MEEQLRVLQSAEERRVQGDEKEAVKKSLSKEAQVSQAMTLHHCGELERQNEKLKTENEDLISRYRGIFKVHEASRIGKRREQ